MKHISLIAFAFVASTAWGQTPQPQGPLTERNVSLSVAAEAAQAAVDKCRADGFRVTVVVLDHAGVIKTVLRDDGTSPHTVDTARKKAFTSLAFRIPSSDFIQRSESNPGLRAIEGTIALGGGLPIRSGNEVIGAIGVGGAPSGDADAACAQAGLDKVATRL